MGMVDDILLEEIEMTKKRLDSLSSKDENYKVVSQHLEKLMDQFYKNCKDVDEVELKNKQIKQDAEIHNDELKLRLLKNKLDEAAIVISGITAIVGIGTLVTGTYFRHRELGLKAFAMRETAQAARAAYEVNMSDDIIRNKDCINILNRFFEETRK